ncbi:CAP domain-containing protein [Bacillus tianshenii]|uniref:CAP domain-containing protein n=1 Tax=Sutcliffiella tianshenii TaxID=1463404 RepID=UPI001CD486CA|nr:CAP domain-containing protein [Bacillus tianshenii]MCA1319547.1 CAP domain-containing protein [Bacillus tianshenii]
MKINKKSIITAVTTAAVLTAAPFGMNAKAEGNAPSKPTCDLGSNVQTFNNQEDAKAFLDNYMKDLENKFGVKVQFGQGQAPAQAEAPQTEAPAPQKQEEQKPAEAVEAPKAEEKPAAEAPAPQQPAPQQQAEAPAENKTEQTASAVSEFEKKVVELTNAERAKQGLAPLELDEELSKVAKEKSNDMKKNNYFAHNSPTYGSPFDMMKQFGIEYRTAGENIAMGQQSPEEVVNAWMNSEGHRANIMNGEFTHIGVGHVEDGNYWTQMFIGK